ncbi:UNVERIFIED_CONTAM: Chitinase 1 [Siphonaria sp. JEL0065]|nr:Chitinase 1 [Siphonaria sp. JEL0065]
MGATIEEAVVEPNVDVQVSDAQKKAGMNKLILIGGAAAVLIIAASLIGYFAAKGNSTHGGTNVSGNATGTAVPTPTGTNGTTPSKGHKLYGYFGADAMANGIDIVKGTLPPPNDHNLYQRPLRFYCDSKNFDTINLAFLNIFGKFLCLYPYLCAALSSDMVVLVTGGGNGGFQITFGGFSNPSYGGSYKYNGDGKEANDQYTLAGYALLGQDILYCQQTYGIKVIMSLGGDKVSPYSFSAGDGNRYAQIFYDMFLEGNGVRPFGPGVKLDGIELDIEKNPAYPNPSPWTGEMVNLLKTLRKLSPNTILAVVPQCYLSDRNFVGKDQNVGDVIPQTTDVIDYLIVQYYNNPVCSYPFNFNFKEWKKIYPGKIVVGLAGDWTSAISGGFLEAGPLQAVYDMVKDDTQFGGFSVYDVSSSTAPARVHNAVFVGNNGPSTNYSTTLRNILDGQIVGSGYPSQDALGPKSNANLGNRCGGTWVHANATCSNKLCDPSSPNCGPNEQCFMFLSPC